jgi:hypothetical protein
MAARRVRFDEARPSNVRQERWRPSRLRNQRLREKTTPHREPNDRAVDGSSHVSQLWTESLLWSVEAFLWKERKEERRDRGRDDSDIRPCHWDP